MVRVCGELAIAIVGSLFRGRTDLREAKANTAHYGEIIRGGEVLDEVVATVFRAPHSFTGEDTVEISCHGSMYIQQELLRWLVDAGCRLAKAGEFTQRAFLNGKVDLAEAEAVADLIASQSKAEKDLALKQLKGSVSGEIALLRDRLLRFTSLIELELDFADHEELEFADRSELYTLANDIHKRLLALARSFEVGNALKNGIPVAIVGNTNVGKSTLLNHLLHEEKAIVSDVHGTTRDFIEDSTVINGIQFRFVDTAGIRDTDDVVENIGIERTYQKMQEAKIVLWLVDRQPEASEIEDIKKRVAGKKLIIVRNKMDLTNSSWNNSSSAKPTIQHSTFNIQNSSSVDISAKYGTNISKLEQLIVEAANIPQLSESDIVITSVRHYSALLHADESLQRVIDSMNLGLSGDLLAEDLRMVIEHLGEITGEEKITPQETLNSIFSSYCIGK